MTGEAAGAAMVSDPTCRAPETLIFSIPGVGYLSHNFVADAPLHVVLSVAELYVNREPPALHNQRRNPAHRVIMPDAAREITKYTCSQKGEMC